MGDLATIAFQSEAFDTAADHFRRIEGYTVKVVPAEGDEFDARFIGLTIGDDGQYKAWFGRWVDALDGPDPNASPIVLDVYDELERVEVI